MLFSHYFLPYVEIVSAEEVEGHNFGFLSLRNIEAAHYLILKAKTADRYGTVRMSPKIS